MTPARLASLAAMVLALLANGAAALSIEDAGEPAASGTATDLVSRRLVLDLWDGGEPKHAYHLARAPDGDAVEVSARAAPVHGSPGPWRSLADFRLNASAEKAAEDAGWDGMYALELRFRLPNAPAARAALLLLDDGGGEALSITTRLMAQVLEFRGGLADNGREVWAVVVGKAPAAVDLVASAGQPTRLAREADGERWHGPAPPGPGAARLVARFADGGQLDGPELQFATQQGGSEAPAEDNSWPSADGEGTPPVASPEGPADAEAHTRAGALRATPTPEPRSGRLLPGPPISLVALAVAAFALCARPRPPPTFKLACPIQRPVGPCTRPRFASR
jgi:hypothetical protein